jgi:hypothetical protein
MSLLRSASQIVKKLPVVGSVLEKIRVAQLDKTKDEKHWKFRIDNVLSCPDNHFIPRVEDAGFVHGEEQVMHNGLRIVPGSYHGKQVSLQLQLNRGVHEPEEERVFQEVLKFMPEGATMLELGAYWGFYSMWFQKEVPKAVNFLVEPASEHLIFGKNNLSLNGMKGDFIQALIDTESSVPPNGTPTFCVDDILEQKGIARLHMLHADIQGFEHRMLQGARKAFENKTIDYAFVSTHRGFKFGHSDINGIHNQCLEFFKEMDYFVIAETNLETTYSWDGLIAVRRKDLDSPGAIDIAKRPPGSKTL